MDVTVVKNPIESFSVIPTKKLIENINGVNGEDENGNSYFNYYIFDTQPRYIIKLKNENEPRIYESRAELSNLSGFRNIGFHY